MCSQWTKKLPSALGTNECVTHEMRPWLLTFEGRQNQSVLNRQSEWLLKLSSFLIFNVW